MVIKKGFLSYIIGLAFVVLLITMSYSIGVRAVNSYNLQDYFKYVICFSFLVITFFTVKGHKILSNLFSGALLDDADSSGNIASVLLFFIVIVSFMVRFIYIISCGDNLNGPSILYNLSLNRNYDEALAISPLHNIYVRLLATVLSLLGSQVANVIYLNVILDILALLLIYFSLNELANRFIALLGACLFALFSCDYASLTSAAPGKLYTLLFLGALFLIIKCNNLIASYSKLRVNDVVLSAAAGLLTGICCLCDFSGFGLCAAYIYMLTNSVKTLPDPRRNRLKKSKKRLCVVEPIAYIFFLIEGYMLAISICMFGKKTVISAFIKEQVYNTYSKIDISISYLHNIELNIFFILLIGIAAAWVISLFKNRTDFSSCIIMPTIIWGFCVIININNDQSSMFILSMLCMLDALAVYSLFEVHQNQLVLEPNVENEIEGNAVFKKKNSKSNERIVSTTSQDSEARIKELEASLDFLKKAHEPDTSADNSITMPSETDSTISDENNDKTNDASANNEESTEGVVPTVTAVYKEDEEDNKPIKSRPYVPSYRSMQYKTAVVNKYSEDENEINDKYVVKKDATVTVAGETVSKTEMYDAMFGTGEDVDDNNDSDDARNDEVEIVAYNRRTIISDLGETSGSANARANKETKNAEESNEVSVDSSKSVEEENADKHDSISEEVSVDEQPAPSSDAAESVQNENESDSSSEAIAATTTEDTVSNDVSANSDDTSNNNEASDKNDNEASTEIHNKPKTVVELPKSSELYNKDNNVSAEAATDKIHNPLPVPKKHTPVEFDFDIEPESQDMHFDIVDLSGKDYFDIN